MERIKAFRGETGAVRFLFGISDCFVVVKLQPTGGNKVCTSVKSWCGTTWVNVAKRWNMVETDEFGDSDWSAVSHIVEQHYSMLLHLLYGDDGLPDVPETEASTDCCDLAGTVDELDLLLSSVQEYGHVL